MLTYIEHKSARFATREEIRAQGNDVLTRYAPNEIAGRLPGGTPIISDGKMMTVTDKDMHTLINGGTASKKTRNVVMPQLVSLANSGESMILYDPKGELYKFIRPKLAKEGYAIRVINLRDLGTGDRLNPLYPAYEYYKNGQQDKAIETLKDVAGCIFNRLATTTDDVYWADSARSMFIGLGLILLKVAPPHGFTIKAIGDLSSEFGNSNWSQMVRNDIVSSDTPVAMYFKAFGKRGLAYQMLRGVIDNANDTRACILSVFNQGIFDFVTGENLCNQMCVSEFDFRDCANEKTAIFFITPDEKSTYNPIVVSMIKTSYMLLLEVADKLPGGQLPIRVNYVLDEFANLPPIPDFDSMMTASRSRNIRFTLAVQSMAQMRKMYGVQEAEIISGNADLTIYLHSRDLTLLNRISDLCGAYRSAYTGEAKPLISVERLQHLRKEREFSEALVLFGREYPYITTLPDISMYDLDFTPDTERVMPERRPLNMKRFNIGECISRMAPQQ